MVPLLEIIYLEEFERTNKLLRKFCSESESLDFKREDGIVQDTKS